MLRTIRRVLVGAAALAVAATGLVATAPEAQAACTIKASHPSKIAITGYYKEVTVKLYDPCERVDWAAWDLIGPEGEAAGLLFDEGETTTYLDVYDWNYPVGSYKVRPYAAYDRDYNSIPQAEGALKIKLGTGAKVTSFRNGSWVGFDVLARYYSPSWGRYRGWDTAAKLQKQYKGTWYTVKTFDLNSSGKARVSLKRKDKAPYRVVVAETSKQWSATSATTWR
ncbi:hypothetical protein GC722_02290 [Auraticoccus sp. F435]|uniref:Tat pathway signal sequence domain protein n=1 Tax=Auraticoccus cholistanensis TaxID=2656650 RepID=A0A6A9UPQ2_9ACTN|nr:hypothetical protein [Auraticoccus cholistanensis]MVA74866.1 hypothetical protein [Auraticoccus cholistanensis]